MGQTTKEYKLVLSSEVENVEKVEELTERVTRSMKFDDDECGTIAIAVTEAFNNAVIHGNKRDASKKVQLSMFADPAAFRVVIKDEGGGFDPDGIPDPLDPENLLKESGRGVFILKSLMDEVLFDFDGTGTTVTLVKSRTT